MDNCGYVRIYWFVTLPLSLPIIATVGVFAFISSWNSFLLPLIMLNSQEKYTWPLGIMQFQGEFMTGLAENPRLSDADHPAGHRLLPAGAALHHLRI